MRIFVCSEDRYHRKEIFEDVLNEACAKIFERFEVLQSPDFVSMLKEEPDLVVIGRSNQNEDKSCWLNEREVQTLAQYIKDGERLFVWHAGLAGYPPDYTELVGGRFIFHPQRALVRYFTTDGFSFEIVDEHYFVELRSNIEVFLWSESNYGRSTAGWKKHVGKGKILALTPAHAEEGLKNERFRSLLAKSLEWLIEES
ncbi:hypothetical protein AS159_05220 [Thermotoga sp. Ku-13t]|uniref:ThuA domain-containing protein n=1 Tax=Thermotoga sp. Ku-13t TaxID=1755813 RepID=UPI0013EBDAC9|nr:ThuA domain-containing protein [Thermotoga sp. Ku-13t]KAF2957808.1 hypothetical protein AS159_05220 [Thermotoga sp. Ku-13t]